jgi:hypothetical protein
MCFDARPTEPPWLAFETINASPVQDSSTPNNHKRSSSWLMRHEDAVLLRFPIRFPFRPLFILYFVLRRRIDGKRASL